MTNKFLLAVLLCIATVSAIAQNVGIGTTNPDKAKLAVIGTANANSNTVAQFGSHAGLTIQQNLPTLSFNGYSPVIGQLPSPLTTGYGMQLTFNHNNGNMAFVRNGFASVGTGTQFSQNQAFLGWSNFDKSLRLNADIPGGTVQMPNEVKSNQTGGLNIIPIGIISASYRGNGSLPYTASAENTAGNLLISSSSLAGTSNNRVFMYLNLDSTQVEAYSKIVVFPGYTRLNGNVIATQGIIRRIIAEYSPKDGPTPHRIVIDFVTADINLSQLDCNIAVYGIR